MKRNPLVLVLLLLVAAIALGDHFWPYGFWSSTPVWPEQPRTWEGIVTQPPRTSSVAQRCIVRLVDDGRLVCLTAFSDSTKPEVGVGDLVVFNARVEVPRNAGNPGEMDYAAYLRHQGIRGQAVCRVGQWRDLGRSASLRFDEQMLIMREHVVATFRQHFDGEALALVSAMTLGDRSGVDRSLRDLYSRSGVSHLLALSGLHLSILFGLLALTLVPMRRWWGWKGDCVGRLLLLVVLWNFVWIAGLPQSLIRAAVMFSIVTLLSIFYHRSSPFHPLVLALVVMLLWRPQWLFDVGLQLSAVAVAAILWVTVAVQKGGVLRRRLEHLSFDMMIWRNRLENRCPSVVRLLSSHFMVRMGQAVGSLLVVSAAAQIATLPLVAHYFGRVSLAGIVASLVAIPAAYLVIFGALVYLILWPLRATIAEAVSYGIGLFHSTLSWVASLPWATIDVEVSWFGVVGIYLLLFWIGYMLFYRRVEAPLSEHHRRHVTYLFRTVAVTAFVLMLIVGGETLFRIFQRPNPQVVIYNRFSRREIHLVTPTYDSILVAPSPHLVGNIVMFADQRIALFDAPFPRVADIEMPDPLDVDVLLVSRGAKGRLSDALLRYRPQLVALDGSLSDYHRERFAEEAAASSLPVYDIREQGALVMDPLRR